MHNGSGNSHVHPVSGVPAPADDVVDVFLGDVAQSQAQGHHPGVLQCALVLGLVQVNDLMAAPRLVS